MSSPNSVCLSPRIPRPPLRLTASGSPMRNRGGERAFPLRHDHEPDPVLVPASQPADPPTVQPIPPVAVPSEATETWRGFPFLPPPRFVLRFRVCAGLGPCSRPLHLALLAPLEGNRQHSQRRRGGIQDGRMARQVQGDALLANVHQDAAWRGRCGRHSGPHRGGEWYDLFFHAWTLPL